VPQRYEMWDKDLTLIKAAKRDLSMAELNLRRQGQLDSFSASRDKPYNKDSERADKPPSDRVGHGG
jgi:hypothetical protein